MIELIPGIVKNRLIQMGPDVRCLSFIAELARKFLQRHETGQKNIRVIFDSFQKGARTEKGRFPSRDLAERLPGAVSE